MLFIIIPMVGIILGSFLAAIGLVVDQQTIETGGMVSMSTFGIFYLRLIKEIIPS